MKCWTTFAALSSLAFANAQFISLPLSKRAVDSGSLNKRASANGSLTLTSQQNAYTANISLGSPAQNVQLVLDTGSPLTWVNARNVSTFTPGTTPTSAQAAQGTSICNTYSCFQASSSSSLTVPSNSTVFLIEYVDGTESVGRIVQDHMVFEGLADSTFDFGLVEYFYSPNGVQSAIGGILGLSPPNAVASFSTLTAALRATSATNSFTPQTILQQLQNAGAITSTAFSLYLSDNNDGELTIGGVDSGRYTGPLTVVPIVNTAATSSGGQSFYVNLDSVGYGGSTSNEIQVGESVVLDSGTTATCIPAQAAEQLAQALNGVFIPYDQSSGLVAVPCSPSTTIDFYFDNSAVIRVPTSAIIDSELTPAQARRLGIQTTSNLCILALFGTEDSESYLLGDSFLRSAYVVYDLDAGSIALAQSQYDQPSNITAIGSGNFGIPGGVYNSSSSGAMNVAVVPSVTRTVSLGTAAPRTTSGVAAAGTGGTTVTAAATTAATTTSSSGTKSAAERLTVSSTSLSTVMALIVFTGLGFMYA